MAFKASASAPEPDVRGGGGGIMEGDTEEAAAAGPGKGRPPPPNGIEKLGGKGGNGRWLALLLRDLDFVFGFFSFFLDLPDFDAF